MWTKTENGLDPLFVAPSTVRNRVEISGYFKYHQVATPLSGMPSSSSNSCVLWKANSARRKRFEPFCSPIAPHVPIRQRLSSRRCTSVDAGNECDEFALSASNPYLCGRRRRMSLLQTLRYQNKQLADSGFECQPNDKTERDMTSPGGTLQKRYSDSPPSSPIEEEKMQKSSRSSLSKLRAKTKAFFGKKGEKESRIMEESVASSDGSSRCCPSECERGIYSCIDFTAKEKNHRKSPSTNDSGRGSQGRLCIDEEHPNDTPGRERNERRETVAVIERPPLKAYMNELSKSGQLRRTISCPQLGLNLRIYHEISRRAISMRNRMHSSDTESGEDEDDFQCSLRDVGRQISDAERSTHPCPQSPRSEKSEEAEGIIEGEDIKFAERMLRDSSPLSAADFLLEKRLQMRALVMRRQQEANTKPLVKSSTDMGIHVSSANRQSASSFPTPPAERSIYSMNEANRIDDMNKNDEVATKLETMALGEVDSRSMSTHASEEFEEDDNNSTTLDHYLPFLSEIYPRRAVRSQRSSSQSSAVNNRSEEDDESNVGQGTRKVLSVTETQTDLSLIHISERLSAYLAELGVTVGDDDLTNDKEGMNFLAKHFFEYQSFVNLPHKAVQLHKTPPSQAGSDPSAAWAPKSMNKAGKNQAAPGARANRNNTDTRPSAHRHGRAGRHEFREWGDRHGELKPEKIVPHKDAWTKFLSNEEGAGKRTMFECEFEDRILQTEPETLPERLSRTEKNSDIEFSVAYPGTSTPSNICETEVLTILTYAPQVQFVTATVKKAKCLPFNNRPFARVMLFEGRRLLEQKQTTITPTITCNGCVSSCSRSKGPGSTSSTPSSSASSGSNKSNDAVFSESFLFHVSPQMLDRCHIVIEMYDSNPEEPDKGPCPIGYCVVGPMCAGTGCAHWFQMVRKTGLPVCMWHRMTKS